jgi:hypothetical protein
MPTPNVDTNTLKIKPFHKAKTITFIFQDLLIYEVNRQKTLFNLQRRYDSSKKGF